MPNNILRPDGGTFSGKVTDEEILATMREIPEPIVTASELADRLPIGRRAVRERLSNLTEEGVVERKQVGARAVVWWCTASQDATAPAAPLQDLIGMVDEETADHAADRSREWREAFNNEIDTGDV